MSVFRALAGAAALGYIFGLYLRDPSRTEERAGQLLQSATAAVTWHVLRRPAPPAIEVVASLDKNDVARQIASSVGILDLGVTDGAHTQWFTCTAVVISPTLVLTNHHCATARDAPGTVTTIAMTTGYSSPGAGNTWHLETKPVELDERLDYAILSLAPQQTRPFPHPLPRIAWRTAIRGERAFLLHHARGRPLQLSRQGCRALSHWTLKPTTLIHTCATATGSSGSLLFSVRDGALLGLHYAADREAPGMGFALSSEALAAASPTLRALGRSPAQTAARALANGKSDIRRYRTGSLSTCNVRQNTVH